MGGSEFAEGVDRGRSRLGVPVPSRPGRGRTRRRVAAVAVAAVVLWASVPVGAGSHRAVRTLDVAAVDPGGEVVVTVEAQDFGRFGRVIELLPGGWTYTGSSLPETAVTVETGRVRFLLLNLDPSQPMVFWYTVTAPDAAGTHVFSGVIEDSDRVAETVGGAGQVEVRSTSAAQGCLQGAGGAAGLRFCDVAVGAYYETPVTSLHADGVLGGTLCEEGFCPSEPVLRKTLAVWLVRLLDGKNPQPVIRSRFGDVEPSGFHGRFIERLAQLGVTRGCGDGNFCPDGVVSRAEMAAFLSRAYRLAAGPDPGFGDVADDAWYAADVSKLAASGITKGCDDGLFCPGRDTTRGELATFLHRAETAKASAGQGGG